jgi:hypothetical protein
MNIPQSPIVINLCLIDTSLRLGPRMITKTDERSFISPYTRFKITNDYLKVIIIFSRYCYLYKNESLWYDSNDFRILRERT